MTAPKVELNEDKTKWETYEHIMNVRDKLNTICVALMERGRVHDASKFSPEELPAFTRCTPLLTKLKYGTPEYKEALKDLGSALKHHYENNTHHPEHYDDGIAGMDILDLVEMFADWAAACERVKDGNLETSIDENKERFDLPDALVSIFQNSRKLFEAKE